VPHLAAGLGAGPLHLGITENGHDFAVAFEAQVLTNDPALNLRLALAGVGLALAREDVVRPYIERGELVAALEEFSTPFPGFYSTTPRAAKPPPHLHALIDYLLQLRQARGEPSGPLTGSAGAWLKSQSRLDSMADRLGESRP
jgi:DNA-binding transcriptional LysR family regulator